ncbi:DUF4476 domain-containing protein [Porphyromonas pogonae]|uniref:DUF4476 domain-containing protein n=1 Tax=Porphyromonas pogonae TaxID=867595 RepID=UPI002E7A5BAC|nr:DUF4476 domain-containing protein [Porphyromonas pogonae]
MKRITALLSWGIMALMLTACGLMLNPEREMMKISKGMSSEEVRQVLGRPQFRRFNQQSEEWEYRNAHGGGVSDVYIITFENNRVVNLNSFVSNDYTSSPPVVIYPDAPRMPRIPGGYPYASVDPNGFEEFYSKVKNTPFDDDKMNLIRMGASNRRFITRDCIRLMKLFSFDDKRLEVLRAVAPGIVDIENVYKIIGEFSFSSGKDEATRILESSKRKKNNYPYDDRRIRPDDASFNELYSKIKSIPFKDDKLNTLKLAGMNRRFTCAQCVRLMNLFSFDDEKLEVARIIIPRVVDLENADQIVNTMSFISGENDVKAILQSLK